MGHYFMVECDLTCLSSHLPRRNMEATLPNHSKERDQAEARFKKAQKATQDDKQARADYESEARTVREKKLQD